VPYSWSEAHDINAKQIHYTITEVDCAAASEWGPIPVPKRGRIKRFKVEKQVQSDQNRFLAAQSHVDGSDMGGNRQGRFARGHRVGSAVERVVSSGLINEGFRSWVPSGVRGPEIYPYHPR